MSLDTTTSDPVESAEAKASTTDEAVDTSQEDNQTEAVDKGEDTSQTSDTVEDEPAEEAEDAEPADNSDETEIKEWAAKKNLPLDDPIKLAKMYRESEKQLGKKGQQEGQLKAAVTTANSEAGTDDVQALRNEFTALSFKVDHPEAGPLEGEMVSILEEKPWLANDLDAVLDMAKGRSVSKSEELLAARQAGKKEALAQAEQAGRAAPPAASASNSAKAGTSRITPDNVDQVIGQHMGDANWYKAHQTEIDAALAG